MTEEQKSTEIAAVDFARVDRDYAVMRLEYLAATSDCSTLKLICETELSSITTSFHEAQRRVLARVSPLERKQEFEVTKEFEENVTTVRKRLLNFTNPNPSSQMSQDSSSSNCAKLPKINLKTFDGLLENWLPFIATFDSLIHNKTNMSDVEKLHYLLSCVEKEPLDLIKTFPICNTSYLDAYNALRDRYHKTRQLANTFYEKLLQCESIESGSGTELQRLDKVFTENLSILEKYKLPDKNFMLVHLLWTKLDLSSRVEFELEHQSNEVPKFEALQAFIRKRCHALSAASPQSTDLKKERDNTRKPSTNNKTKQKSSSFVATSLKCVLCSDAHSLWDCSKFLEKPATSRFEFVKESKLCILCLLSSHSVKTCRSNNKCNHCGYSHHTLLHFDKKPVVERKQKETKEVKQTDSCPTSNTLSSQVVSVHSIGLLSTAKAFIKNSKNQNVAIRVLFDSASETNFISDDCRKKLKLEYCSTSPIAVRGIAKPHEQPLGVVECMISTNAESSQNVVVEASVLEDLNHSLPSSPFKLSNTKEWKHLTGLTLADPDFNVPNPIDMILGSHIFGRALLPGLIKGDDHHPVALNTAFGWVIMGGSEKCSAQSRNTFHIANTTSLEDSLKKFWELENVPSSKKILSPKEKLAEENFVKKHCRTETGRYIVPIPFAEPDTIPIFSGTRSIALKRFLSLENKFKSNPDFHEKYVAFMKDYASSQHLERADPPSVDYGQFYYIPHHGILRDSVSTPLRVVFDASAKDAQGVSLNSTLLEGEKLQTSIFNLLVRFRWHSIVFTADVKQMYRQILVPPSEADYQRILWRNSPSDPIQDFRLLTVTYGVKSAPFQALRTVSQLAMDSKISYPNASAIIERDIYMDDVISGSDDVAHSRMLRSELTDMFVSAGFHLRKWTSNSKEFLQGLESSELYTEDFLNFDSVDDLSLKVLGLRWLPVTDTFTFTVSVQNNKCTKRIILSEIARIFDPLGFLSPLTFLAKYLMQLLWISGVSWDEPPPERVSREWLTIKSQLPNLSLLSIPRRMISSTQNLQLHGFCDASERGFCAVIYLRCENAESGTFVRLVCAKSKVAPLKRVTIPRLELLAATLLSDVMHSVQGALKPFCCIEEVFAWSDSSVSLTWIKSCPSKWKTFVSNRVSDIQDKIPPSCWKHVRSADNPADCGSRGLTPDELVSHTLWWNGPAWLTNPETAWPHLSLPLDEDALQCEQKIYSLLSFNNSDFVTDLLNKFSSMRTLKRVLAYCCRFVHNLKNRSSRLTGALSFSETNQSLMFLVKHVQEVSFATELQNLSKNKPNALSKDLRKLSPFVDERGFLRVGGRLANANVHYDQRHPLLLPRQHRLTYLIITEYHQKYTHPGLQTLHHLLSQTFWILSAKRAIRSVISSCHKCFRCRPVVAPAPIMANLPRYRINELKPFSCVCVDYGGPFHITLGRYRGAKAYKAYVCVFVCTATKAVHVELATELTTEAFVAALRRFVARRGRCNRIISDQGTNFVGASNHITSIMKTVTEVEEIKFDFNPPGSPHFSGLAEAGIKSVKTHLARVIGLQRLTYEELYTLLTQIEALLNSRPLTQVSSDPNDLSVLTPGHFLTLEPMSSVPEEDLSNQKIGILNRWKLIQKMHRDFWDRWHKEYIHSLQQKLKWNKFHTTLTVGTMVLILDEQCSPLKWKTGRITDLHPGVDGVCRVVTLLTSNGSIKRPVVKLCPLPLLNNEQQ